jgi:hypothetical protein
MDNIVLIPKQIFKPKKEIPNYNVKIEYGVFIIEL